MIDRRRAPALLAGIVLALSLLCAATPPLRVRADAPAAPVVTRVTPQSIVKNGKPIRITLTGTGMSGVTIVFLAPVVGQRSFVAFNDTTLLLTLPADLPAGDYNITLQSAGGTNDPADAVFGVRAAAPGITGGGTGPVTIPQYSFAPYPDAVAVPATDGGAPRPAAATPGAPAVASGSDLTSNPALIITAGMVAGGLLYLLWGRPGRAEMARRRGFLSQLVMRPMQQLHLGRICVRCGRLHWYFATRRDLWKAGRFCSATCFVADQEEDITVRDSESRAGSRLRGVGIYAHLEQQLELVFAGEAASVGTASNLFGAEGSRHATAPEAEATGPVDDELPAGAAADTERPAAVDPVASVLRARSLVQAAHMVEESDRVERHAQLTPGLW